MAILFAGARPWQFATTGTVSTLYRSPHVTHSASNAHPVVIGTTPVSSIWASAYMNFSSNVTGTSYSPWVFRGGGVDLVRVRGTGTAYQLVLEIWNGSTWDALHTFTVTVTGSLVKFGFRITLADSGTIEIFTDNTLIHTYSGDTLLTAQATIDEVELNRINSTATYISAILVSDNDTHDWEICDLPPTAAGTHSDGVGTYADVDDTSLDDANFVSLETVGAKSSFQVADVPSGLRSGYDVHSLLVASRPRGTGASFRSHILSGASPASGATITPGSGFENRFDEFLTDPATGAAWTIAGLDGVEIGPEVPT